MAKAIDTGKILELLGALHGKEAEMVGRLRGAGVGETTIARAMNSTPQGLAKRFPAGKIATAAARPPAAPGRAGPARKPAIAGAAKASRPRTASSGRSRVGAGGRRG